MPASVRIYLHLCILNACNCMRSAPHVSEGRLRASRPAPRAPPPAQLPPTVVSEAAEQGGLGVTLFERLHALVGVECCALLTTQYRMHERICAWASNELYEGKLQPAAAVATHRCLLRWPRCHCPRAVSRCLRAITPFRIFSHVFARFRSVSRVVTGF